MRPPISVLAPILPFVAVLAFASACDRSSSDGAEPRVLAAYAAGDVQYFELEHNGEAWFAARWSREHSVVVRATGEDLEGSAVQTRDSMIILGDGDDEELQDVLWFTLGDEITQIATFRLNKPKLPSFPGGPLGMKQSCEGTCGDAFEKCMAEKNPVNPFCESDLKTCLDACDNAKP